MPPLPPLLPAPRIRRRATHSNLRAMLLKVTRNRSNRCTRRKAIRNNRRVTLNRNSPLIRLNPRVMRPLRNRVTLRHNRRPTRMHSRKPTWATFRKCHRRRLWMRVVRMICRSNLSITVASLGFRTTASCGMVVAYRYIRLSRYELRYMFTDGDSHAGGAVALC